MNAVLSKNSVHDFYSRYGSNSLYYTVSLQSSVSKRFQITSPVRHDPSKQSPGSNKDQEDNFIPPFFKSEKVANNLQYPEWKQTFTFPLDSGQETIFFEVLRHNSSDPEQLVDQFALVVSDELKNLQDQSSHQITLISEKDNSFILLVRWRYEEAKLKLVDIKKKIHILKHSLKKEEQKLSQLQTSFAAFSQLKPDCYQVFELIGLQLDHSPAKNVKQVEPASKPLGRKSSHEARSLSKTKENKLNNSNQSYGSQTRLAQRQRNQEKIFANNIPYTYSAMSSPIKELKGYQQHKQRNSGKEPASDSKKEESKQINIMINQIHKHQVSYNYDSNFSSVVRNTLQQNDYQDQNPTIIHSSKTLTNTPSQATQIIKVGSKKQKDNMGFTQKEETKELTGSVTIIEKRSDQQFQTLQEKTKTEEIEIQKKNNEQRNDFLLSSNQENLKTKTQHEEKQTKINIFKDSQMLLTSNNMDKILDKQKKSNNTSMLSNPNQSQPPIESQSLQSLSEKTTEILQPTSDNLKRMELKNQRKFIQTSIASSTIDQLLQQRNNVSQVSNPKSGHQADLSQTNSLSDQPKGPIGIGAFMKSMERGSLLGKFGMAHQINYNFSHSAVGVPAAGQGANNQSVAKKEQLGMFGQMFNHFGLTKPKSVFNANH